MEMEGKPLYWAALGLSFMILAAFPTGPLFAVLFFTILIYMRVVANQMSQYIWVAFWLSAMRSWTVLDVEIPLPAHGTLTLISTVVRFFIHSDYEMPTLAFWVLLVLLLQSNRKPSVGAVVYWNVLIFNLHLRFDGIHLPGLLVSWYFIQALVALFVLAMNAVLYPKYIPTVFLWFGCIGILHKQMWPYNKDFGLVWVAAWWLSLHAILFAFAPDMPVLWYIMWVGIVVGLGFGYRPDESLGGFILWVCTIIVLRMVLFYIYVAYILNTDRDKLFPFNLFSRDWGMSGRRWFPLSARRHDSLNSESLCERCDGLTSESKIILGSSFFFKRMVEWHDFYTRKEFVSRFRGTYIVGQGATARSTAFPESSCHLCCLLWYSMSPQRQQDIIGDAPTNSAGSTARGADPSLAVPKDPEAGLRVKVWEERPSSLFSYMQLFWGDTPVGARLLIHSKDPPATASIATAFEQTDSESHFEQARNWLEMCRIGHKLCRGVGNSKRALPARMIYVSSGEGWARGSPPESLRLVDTTDMDASAEYLALSHCWGPDSDMKFKLLASNIDACYKGIDFAGLSPNMQHAITITLALGFSYIWIDSLCIIQQGRSGAETGETAEKWKADWTAEAKKMGSVYSGAACTIASTGSATSAGGCFHTRSRASLRACKIGVSSPDALAPQWVYARRDDVFSFERGVDLAPLNTRGWVMQERLLSRRILHFGADMLYWECGLRSASELGPHGYTYKVFPEDFKDNYMPELESYISTRGEMQAAEREGRGLSWGTKEQVRRRPPPVMIDPDARPGSQAVWQQKRGFWKNVLKPNDEPWEKDDGPRDQDKSGPGERAGFRAAFEKLRAGEGAATKQVGRESPSQVWYDVVEPYSRRTLTKATEKLMALKGIEDEVARARKWTYLSGLWKEQLVTDLLWFAIEGPGHRLLSEEGTPVAPAWSWASIDGAVALDLLPETTRADIEETETLVTHCDPSLGADDPCATTITLRGPLLPVTTPVFDAASSTWGIEIGGAGTSSAQFFPDVREPEAGRMSDLACMTFLVLEREKKKSLIPSSSEDVQGLVLRLARRGDGGGDSGARDVYERVGYFTTSYVAKSRASKRGRKALRNAAAATVCLSGWTNPGHSPAASPAGGE